MRSRSLLLAAGLLAAAANAPAAAQPAAVNDTADDEDEEEADEPETPPVRVENLTDEVDRCAPRIGLDDKELTRRAADHYNRGIVLYDQGDYEAAITEFVQAYCDKPHASMFYSVGQAHERLIHYEKAVAYFERFIMASAENVPDRKKAEIRVGTLRALPARILVATAPANAEVTLLGDSGVRARVRADGKTALEVLKGSYEMRIELPGYEPIKRHIVAEIGQPYSYYFQLEPKKGTVRVVATPPEARIFLGDRLVGIGSYVETVPVGDYRVVVEAEGRPSQRRPLEVDAGKTTDLTIDLGQPPKSGRWELVLASGLFLGFGAGGVANTLFDQRSSISTMVGIAGLGIGFGGAYLGVPADVPLGTTSYLIGSTAIGAAEGAVVASIFAGKGCFASSTKDLDEEEINPTCNDDAVGASAAAGGAAGAVFASLTASRFDLDAGDAALINSGALWGSLSGLLFWSSFERDERVFEPMALAGLNLGIVVGATVAARSQVSRSRVSLIDLAGLGGLVVGFAVGAGIDTADERLAHTSLVGMATGLIAGTYLTRNYDAPKTGLRPTVATTADRGFVAGLATSF
jgi:hypothetical protein